MKRPLEDIPRGAPKTLHRRRKESTYRRWIGTKTTLPGIVQLRALQSWGDGKRMAREGIPLTHLQMALVAGCMFVVSLFVWALIRASL